MMTISLIFDWLVTASLRASLVVLTVGALQYLLRKKIGARARYALWLPVAFVLLTPAFPESRWSVQTVFVTAPAVQTSPPPSSEIATLEVAPTTLLEIPTPSIDWHHLLPLAWLSGSVLLTTLIAFSHTRSLRRYGHTRLPVSDALHTEIIRIAQQVGLKHPPHVWRSPEVRSPAITSLFKPLLLLPASFEKHFTTQEARLILQHELTHLKRKDLPLNALMCLLITLHWFNPVLWLAFFKIRTDREAACDAQVLTDAAPDRRRDYGHALLKVESAFTPAPLSLGFIGLFQRGAALRLRIQSIANPHPTSPTMKLLTLVLVCALAFLGITRAEQPSSTKEDAALIAVEVKIIEFTKATDWEFGGRLPSAEDSPFSFSVLSPAELTEQLREEMRKDGVNITSYPRMVTLNDKEVLVKSVVNQPYNGKDGQITHLPIGLVLKMKPSIQERTINLNIDLSYSQLVGYSDGKTTPTTDDTQPIVSIQTYKSSHETRDGQSSVIVGWVDGKPQSKRPLLYVITPYLINSKAGGLPADSIFDGSSSKANDFTPGKSTFRPGDSLRIR